MGGYFYGLEVTGWSMEKIRSMVMSELLRFQSCAQKHRYASLKIENIALTDFVGDFDDLDVHFIFEVLADGPIQEDSPIHYDLENLCGVGLTIYEDQPYYRESIEDALNPVNLIIEYQSREPLTEEALEIFELNRYASTRVDHVRLKLANRFASATQLDLFFESIRETWELASDGRVSGVLTLSALNFEESFRASGYYFPENWMEFLSRSMSQSYELSMLKGCHALRNQFEVVTAQLKTPMGDMLLELNDLTEIEVI